MDQIQPTIYQEMPTDLRRASKVIVLAGNQFREYDLNQFGKDRIYLGAMRHKMISLFQSARYPVRTARLKYKMATSM